MLCVKIVSHGKDVSIHELEIMIYKINVPNNSVDDTDYGHMFV